MESRRLGTSELHITPIGMGTWAIGGGANPYGWGPQDDSVSIATIHRALDLGINWIDTAAGYGHGHSEEIVGRALSGRRERPIVATKCGILWKEDGSDIYGHLKAESIQREVDGSLRRLQVEAIDLYQIHWPLPDEGIEEGWGAIADLIRAGKVRYGGVSNFSVAQLERVLPIHRVTSLQPPYSMLERGVETDLLAFCAAHQIGVIVYSPMQAGILTGAFSRERAASLPDDDWRRKSLHFQEPGLSANLELVEGLRSIAARAGRTLAQLAIAWTLRRPEVTGAIVGSRRPQQVDETLLAAKWKLTADEVAEVEALLDRRKKALEATA